MGLNVNHIEIIEARDLVSPIIIDRREWEFNFILMCADFKLLDPMEHPTRGLICWIKLL